MRHTRTVLLAVLCCFGCAAARDGLVVVPVPPPDPIPEELRLTETEQYPGQNDLVRKVGTSNLVGRVQILDWTIDTDDSWHADRVKRIVMNAGVPGEHVFLQADHYVQHDGKLNSNWLPG